MEEKNTFDITIVICSRNNHDEKIDFLHHVGQTCGVKSKIIFRENNVGISLTEIYKIELEKAETNLVVFMHDDIEFLKPNWGLELIKLFEEYSQYGIIGVAGSAEFDQNGAWWNYKQKYGQVLHRHNGEAWLTEFSPLIENGLQEVCVVDGLFFAVRKDRISQTFDTNFQGFNFYEIDFCLANYFDKKCKIGVTTNIRLAHNSIGELKPNWYENRDKLNQKYQNNFPVKMKVKK